MELALAIAVLVGLSIASASLATGSRARRAAAFALVLTAGAVPYGVASSHVVWRALLSAMVLAAVIRNSDLVLRREPTPLLRRVTHVLSIADSFRLRRAPPVFDARAAIRAVFLAALLVASYAVSFTLAPRVVSHAPRLAVRWLGGLVFTYALVDLFEAALSLVYRGIGFVPPVMHRHPILARSVREFWGLRWNRIVSAWLDARFARPLAKRGRPKLGALLAFVASAALHWYVAAPALGPAWAMLVFAFFVVQGLLALAEGPLRVARWRPALAHVWTVSVLALSSPLFCEPLLRILSP